MQRVRRSQFAVLRISDRADIDWMAAALGIHSMVRVPQLMGVSPISGTTHPLEQTDVQLMLRMTGTDWEECSALESEGWTRAQIEALVDKGLVIADPPPDDRSGKLRAREDLLRREGWEPNAALYHFLGRWSEMDVRGPDGGPAATGSREVQQTQLLRTMTDEVQRIADRHGPMPPAIHSPPSASSVSLPDPRLDGDLFDLLRKRCTTREFSGQGLDAETLSTLLHHVFGCVAERKTAVGPLLRKTSPSGGSLHPIEVYPLVINVRGVEPGLYHYNVGRHGLGQMESMPQAEAADLAQRFAAGQPFAGGGSVLFILAARFGRTFWKYRQHAKAYRVVMMDVGHLSQTFYMTCAHLGLGAFFTAAVNEECIQERLGFEDGAQDALAVMGTGVPSI